MKQLCKKGKRKCYVCKKILPLTSEYFASHKGQTLGLSYICKNCDNKIDKKKKYNYFGNPKYHYYNYKCGAKSRKLSWDLSFDEFMTFWQKPCHYCGDDIKTIGLDRIDNKKGYKINNITSCCIKCNKMKLDMSKKDFIKQCAKIIKMSGSGVRQI